MEISKKKDFKLPFATRQSPGLSQDECVPCHHQETYSLEWLGDVSQLQYSYYKQNDNPGLMEEVNTCNNIE